MQQQQARPVAYLAIGSMMNSTALQLRGIFPQRTEAAVLAGYARVFCAPTAMASLLRAEPEDKLHSVLHWITVNEMQRLDKMEAQYDRIQVTVQLYDGTAVEAFSYSYQSSFWVPAMGTAPPSERYIDIACRGARAAGMHEAAVLELEGIEVVPRKNPADFQQFAVRGGVALGSLPLMTMAEVAKQGLLVFNGKVLDRAPNFEELRAKYDVRTIFGISS